MYSIETCSASETENIGEVLGKLLQSGDIIALDGDLGAGKTVLAKGVARGLGIQDQISSPTFTLINEYYGKLPFYHFDVYRLNNPEELEDLGYEDFFYGTGVTMIEWSKLIKGYLPDHRFDIYIEKSPDQDNLRVLHFISYGERYNRLLEELKQHVRSGN